MRTQTAPLTWDVFVAPAELTVLVDLLMTITQAHALAEWVAASTGASRPCA